MKNIIKKYKSIPLTAKAALWFVICTLMQKCISFITVPIFTRIMPSSEYGIYSTYLSWYSILTVICTLNMHNCIYSNEISKTNDEIKKNNIAIPLLSLSETLTIVLFIIYIFFHSYINKIVGLSTPLICLLFLQILFEPPVNLWLTKQRFEYKYINLVVRTIIMVLLNAGLGILFVYLSKNNQALARALSIVLVQIIFGGIFYIYFYKKANKIFSIKNWKHILTVQLPLLPHSLSLTILSSSDRIMINKIVDSISAGIYSVAYSAGYVVNVLKNSISDALKPWIYKKIKNEEFNEIKETLKPLLIIILFITIMFMEFAPEIIMIMAPKEYYQAIYIIPPVAASSYFTFLYNTFSSISFYYEKTTKIMFASISAAIMNIFLNLIFIPKYGYIAAGYTTLVCYILFSIFHYLIMKNTCKEKGIYQEIFDIKYIVLLSIIVLMVTVISIILYSYYILRYLFVILIIMIIVLNRKKMINTYKKIKRKEY